MAFGAQKRKKELQRIALLAIAGLILLSLAISLFSMIMRSISLSRAKGDDSRMVKQVAERIAFPIEEKPQIITVQEAEKAKQLGVGFFAAAQDGDKALLYMQNKKAVLYRPSTKKIIDVAPISVQKAGEPAVTPAQKPTVTILNGSGKDGLGARIQTMIGASAQVISVANAKQLYTKTLVIPQSDAQKVAAQALATSLTASVATMPQGEDVFTTDLLVIVGKDRI